MCLKTIWRLFLMKHLFGLLLLVLVTQGYGTETKSEVNSTQKASPPSASPVLVEMVTNKGTITLQLNPEKAPKTVENFLGYVKEGFYNGTIFHRVIDNFMIQGGGFTAEFQQLETDEAIQNEADNGLKNMRGTIAMARTSDPHSATAQFFINVKDNYFLNYTAPTRKGWGYTVFGRVIEGMAVVDKIKQVETGKGGPFRTDVPEKAIVIERMSLKETHPTVKMEKATKDSSLTEDEEPAADEDSLLTEDKEPAEAEDSPSGDHKELAKEDN